MRRCFPWRQAAFGGPVPIAREILQDTVFDPGDPFDRRSATLAPSSAGAISEILILRRQPLPGICGVQRMKGVRAQRDEVREQLFAGQRAAAFSAEDAATLVGGARIQSTADKRRQEVA